MPTIERFHNFKITMYFDDHGVAHFHIITPEMAAKVTIESLEVIAGEVPPKILKEATEWAKERNNRKLLREKWKEFSG